LKKCVLSCCLGFLIWQHVHLRKFLDDFGSFAIIDHFDLCFEQTVDGLVVGDVKLVNAVVEDILDERGTLVIQDSIGIAWEPFQVVLAGIHYVSISRFEDYLAFSVVFKQAFLVVFSLFERNKLVESLQFLYFALL
jgi:hypothetical protein